MNEEMTSILARWASGDGMPYKGRLIDWGDYQSDQENIGCMCAQGQVLHLVGGWSPERLRSTEQEEADRETAALLNISRAHAVLLRHINDSVDDAPSIVLTNPQRVLGNEWSRVLDLWWAFDQFTAGQWGAARVAARATAGVAAWVAAGATAGVAAGVAAGDAARVAAWATAEVQGEAILFNQSKPLFFLPAFGFKSSADIPPRPADYGNGFVPHGQTK